LIVTEHALIDDDQDECETYNLLFHRGQTRRSVALGLLAEGRSMLGTRGDDDD
jgi:hypothetical protein